MAELCLHSGGRLVTSQELAEIPTPVGTRTWTPVPHHQLFEMTLNTLTHEGFRPTKIQLGIKDGKVPNHETEHGNGIHIPSAQFFALMDLQLNLPDKSYGITCGLRNSHDKSLAAGIALGSRVFVCDNLAFSGEHTLARKHTRFILRDVQGKVLETVRKIPKLAHQQHNRITTYRQQRITDNAARVCLCRTAEQNILPWSALKPTWQHWIDPKHDEFRPRNAWSLFNAFTETMKRYSVDERRTRSIKLHTYFDKALSKTN